MQIARRIVRQRATREYVEYVLTQTEAKVLAELAEAVRVPELAVATRMTVSEVRAVVDHLVEKNLVNSTLMQQGVVSPTSAGFRAVQLLATPPQELPRQGESVRVIPDEGETKGAAAPAEVDLDKAIDSALAKLHESR